ncbi:DUF2254 domain-containing protein (plasmid) [Pseudalkalibacillus hwajinpoensis]|uniref:DUF2254 domain-containing protein n=1 Tax=Guptibacillus hwajinpoensis TaxID=208199 RepID=UPI00325BE99A
MILERYNSLKSSHWFIPLLFILITFFGAMTTIYFENMFTHASFPFLPEPLFTSYNTGETILRTLFTSLFTLVLISFSVTLVVLTTYLSNYSPRIIQSFLQDPFTSKVLGIFLGGIFYVIMLWLNLKETNEGQLYISPAFSIVYSIVCLIYFVLFISHTISWLKVTNIVERITNETLLTIKNNRNTITSNIIKKKESLQTENTKLFAAKRVFSIRSGYIHDVDIQKLLEMAIQDNIIVKVEKNSGDYVDETTVLLSYYKNSKIAEKKYIDTVMIGAHRSSKYDIEYGIQKLVEIALRSLATMVNDPYTASVCINKLGKVLSVLAKDYEADPLYFDQHNNLRIITEKPPYSFYLYRSLYQIRPHAKEDVSILAEILHSLSIAAEGNNQKIKDELWKFGRYVLRGFNFSVANDLDYKFINNKYKLLADKTNYQASYRPIEKHSLTHLNDQEIMD